MSFETGEMSISSLPDNVGELDDIETGAPSAPPMIVSNDENDYELQPGLLDIVIDKPETKENDMITFRIETSRKNISALKKSSSEFKGVFGKKTCDSKTQRESERKQSNDTTRQTQRSYSKHYLVCFVLCVLCLFAGCIYFNIWCKQKFDTCKDEYREEYSTFYIHRVNATLVNNERFYLTFQYNLTMKNAKNVTTISGQCIFDYLDHIERFRRIDVGEHYDFFVSAYDQKRCKFDKTSYDWRSKCTSSEAGFAMSIVLTIFVFSCLFDHPRFESSS